MKTKKTSPVSPNLTAAEYAALADMAHLPLETMSKPGKRLRDLTVGDLERSGPTTIIPWAAVTALQKIAASGIWSPQT